MKKASIAIIAAALLIFITAAAYFLFFNDRKETAPADEIVVVYLGLTSFNDRGILEYDRNDYLLRFTDAVTGVTVVVCDKPNCEHPSPDKARGIDSPCNAALPGLINGVAMYKDKIYFVAEDIEGMRHSDIRLLSSDLNGGNRKTVADIHGVANLFPYNYLFKDDKMFMTFINNYDPETRERLEKKEFGGAVVDLKTGDVAYLQKKSDANMYTNILYYNAAKKILYYDAVYQMENDGRMIYSVKIELYSFNLETGEERLVYSHDASITWENILFVLGITDTTLYLTKVSCDELKTIIPERDPGRHTCIIEYDLAAGKETEYMVPLADFILAADGEKLILANNRNARNVYNEEKGYYDYFSDGMTYSLLNADKTISPITESPFLLLYDMAVTENWVYFTDNAYDNDGRGKLIYYNISKAAFYNGSCEYKQLIE